MFSFLTMSKQYPSPDKNTCSASVTWHDVIIIATASHPYTYNYILCAPLRVCANWASLHEARICVYYQATILVPEKEKLTPQPAWYPWGHECRWQVLAHGGSYAQVVALSLQTILHGHKKTISPLPSDICPLMQCLLMLIIHALPTKELPVNVGFFFFQSTNFTKLAGPTTTPNFLRRKYWWHTDTQTHRHTNTHTHTHTHLSLYLHLHHYH